MELTEGHWADGKLNGQGIRKYATGEEFSGNWIDDHLEGHGYFSNDKGDIYSGNFHQSLEHGFGHRFYQATKTEYIGEWDNGLHNGKGTLTNKESGAFYEG